MTCWLLAALVVAAAAAGTADAGEPAWGFYGGINVANMGGDMDQAGEEIATELENLTGEPWDVSKGSKTGFGFGAYYQMPLAPTVGLQLEGLYVRRGVNFDLSSTNFGGDAAFKLDYFEIPVLLRFAPGTGEGKTSVVILVGPVIGFKAGADLEVSAEDASQTMDVGDGFKSTVFGAVGGVGLKVALAPTSSLMLQARYHLGLSNAIDDPAGETSSKAQDFGFFAGLEFGLGR